MANQEHYNQKNSANQGQGRTPNPSNPQAQDKKNFNSSAGARDLDVDQGRIQGGADGNKKAKK